MIQKKYSKGDYYFTVASSKKYKLLEHWIPMKSHNPNNEDTHEVL